MRERLVESRIWYHDPKGALCLLGAAGNHGVSTGMTTSAKQQASLGSCSSKHLPDSHPGGSYYHRPTVEMGRLRPRKV